MPSPLAYWLSRLSLLGAGTAVVIVLLGHFDADRMLSPVGSTISAYAAMDPAGPVELGIYLSGLACLTLCGAMCAARVPAGRILPGSLIVGGAGFLVAAVIPTVEVGEPMTTAGLVHRYAAVVGCVALIIATLRLVRLAARLGWQELRSPLRAVSWVSSASGLAVVYATFWGDRVFIGLYERILCSALLVTLIVVSAHLLRLPGPAQRRDVALAA